MWDQKYHGDVFLREQPHASLVFVRGATVKNEDSPVVERAKLSSERLPLLFDVGDEDFDEPALENLTVDETCFC